MEMDTFIFKGIDFPPEPFITSFTMQSFFTSRSGAGKGSSTGKAASRAGKPYAKSPSTGKSSVLNTIAAGAKKSSSNRSSE